MKILIGDIELSRAVYQAYPSNKPQYLRRENMIHPQFMFSFAYNWYGEKEIYVPSILDNKELFKKDFRDDSALVTQAHELLSSADVFVGHNSDGFDLKHINYKAHLLGLSPIEIAKVDTLKQARKFFKAPSNSLDNLLKDLGHAGKREKPTEAEWFKATLGDEKVIRKIVKYNAFDVEGQIFLYEKIRPWMTNHPNYNLFIRDEYGNEIGVCRKCGSPDLVKDKRRRLASGSMRYVYKCNSCGGFTTFAEAILRAKYR